MFPESAAPLAEILAAPGAAVVGLILLYGLYRTHRDRQRLLAAMAQRGVRMVDAVPSLLSIALGLHILGSCMGWVEPLGNVGLWPVPLQWAFGFGFATGGALTYPHTVARSHDMNEHNVR